MTDYVIVTDDPAGIEDFMFWSDDNGLVETIGEATRFSDVRLMVSDYTLGDRKLTIADYLREVGYKNVRPAKLEK